MLRDEIQLIFSFVEEFQNFEKCGKVEVADLEKRFKDLSDGVAKIESEMSEMEKLAATLKGKEGEEDKIRGFECFNAVFPAFLEEAKAKNEKFSSRLQSVKNDVKEVGEMFGEGKDYKTKDFLTTLTNFAKSVKTSIKYNCRSKVCDHLQYRKIEESKLQEAKKAAAQEASRNRSKSMLEPSSSKNNHSKLILKKKDSKEKHHKKERDPHKERGTFKERVSVSMRQTIRQRTLISLNSFTNILLVKKDLHSNPSHQHHHHHNKALNPEKPLSRFAPDDIANEQEENESKKEMNVTVIKRSGLISFK